MRKTKSQLAKEKLASIETIFNTLKNYLAQGKKIRGKYVTLSEGIQEYAKGLENHENELCYAACVRIYQTLKLKKYLANSAVKDKIKERMREIAKEFFLHTPAAKNNNQLNLF